MLGAGRQWMAQDMATVNTAIMPLSRRPGLSQNLVMRSRHDTHTPGPAPCWRRRGETPQRFKVFRFRDTP
jgi:hypothetical protein